MPTGNVWRKLVARLLVIYATQTYLAAAWRVSGRFHHLLGYETLYDANGLSIHTFPTHITITVYIREMLPISITGFYIGSLTNTILLYNGTDDVTCRIHPHQLAHIKYYFRSCAVSFWTVWLQSHIFGTFRRIRVKNIDQSQPFGLNFLHPVSSYNLRGDFPECATERPENVRLSEQLGRYTYT